MSSSTLSFGKHLWFKVYRHEFPKIVNKRHFANVVEEAKRQSSLFDLEYKQQEEKVGRIEKIQVICEEARENVNLVMNKNVSTPYDCAKHLGEMVAKQSALAIINGNTLWHMHKPLQDSCNVQFLHYNVAQPAHVNNAYWRTCSFLLGAVINKAFKDDVKVNLHSFPSPNVRSGSFIYDAQLSLEDWTPTESELRVLSVEMIKFCQEDHPILCLDVAPNFALEIFKHNMNKKQQIPNIADNNNGRVTLFKAGDHVDISKGPMVTSTGHLGRITISNVFKLNSGIAGDPLYRFQGVSLPRNIILNHFSYGLLENRAKQLNPARIPGHVQEMTDVSSNFI